MSVLSLALPAAFGAMVPLSASADTTISGIVTSYDNTDTSNVTVTGSNIVMGTPGILNTITMGTLTVNGLLSVGTVNADHAVENSGTILSLINSGTIIGGYGIYDNGGSIGTITNSGLIQGNGGNAIYVNSPIAAIINNTGGTITSTGYNGIYNGVSIGTLNNQGLISSTNNGNSNLENGFYNGGTVTSLVNGGTMTATNGAGLINTGLITSLNNSGTISGATALSNSGSIGTLTNSGIITSNTFAITNSGTLTTITNSGTIAGTIRNQSNLDQTINGGTGSTFGTLTGFTAGSVGTITSSNANVIFGAGNLLLNDNVNAGIHTVSNAGATLQINTPLTITGNYTQGAAATLLVGVGSGAVAGGSLAGDSGYGQLVVSGTANLAAGSAVTLLNRNTYAFAAGQRFVVIDALSSGTNYNQTALKYSIAGGSSLVVTGTNVANGTNSDLVLSVASASSTPSLTTPSITTPASTTATSTPASTPTLATVPNAQAALGGLARYSGLNPALLNVFNPAQALTGGVAGTANSAGQQLSPASQASASHAAAAPFLDVLNIVSSHSDSLRLAQADSGVSTGESGPKWGVWAQTFGGHASQDGRDQVDGYNADYAGLLAGIDYAISDSWRAGGAFTYSHASVNNTGNTSGDSTGVNSYGLVGYASYVAPAWYANLALGAVQQSYNTNRVINFTGFSGNANGSFNGQQYVARGEAGYPLALGVVTVTPLASLTYSYLDQSSYTESGGNGAALSVGSTHSTSVTSDLGGKIERELPTAFGVFVPDLRIAWRHEYDNSRVSTAASFAGDPSGQTAFTTVGATPVANKAVIAVGVTLLRSNNLSLTARYEGQFASGFSSQTGSLRVRQLF